MQDLKAFVDCGTETELSSLFSVSLSLSWPSLHHGRVTKTIKGIMRKLTLSCDTYAKIATVNVHNSLQIKYFTFTMTKFLYSLSPVCDRSFSLDQTKREFSLDQTYDMDGLKDLLALKTLHWFSYRANVCWILLGIILSANRVVLIFAVTQIETMI